MREQSMKGDLNKKGFTMVELSLSIVFISVLSVAVVIMISNAVSAYHKGLTLNQINTAGMAITDDMRTTVQGSPANSIAGGCAEAYVDSNENNAASECEKNKALNFVYMEKNANIRYQNNDESIGDFPIYGVFCTGAYSYLWNSGYLFNEDYNVGEGKLALTYKTFESGDGPGIRIEDFKLLKVEDKNRLVCKIAAGYNEDESESHYYNDITTNNIDISGFPVNDTPIDLLGESNNLRIYSLQTAQPAEDSLSGHIFYQISFKLGTIRGGINADAVGCTPPEADGALEDFDYCAINNFNFAAMATGG